MVFNLSAGECFHCPYRRERGCLVLYDMSQESLNYKDPQIEAAINALNGRNKKYWILYAASHGVGVIKAKMILLDKILKELVLKDDGIPMTFGNPKSNETFIMDVVLLEELAKMDYDFSYPPFNGYKCSSLVSTRVQN